MVQTMHHSTCSCSTLTLRLCSWFRKSIMNYFRPSNGLPEPNGSLSLHVPSQAIALANKEVEKVLKEGSGVDKTKCGKYNG